MEQITEQVKKVIAYSQNLNEENINVDNLISQWWENKKDYYHAFGNKYIYEYGEVTGTISPEGKQDLYNQFREKLDNLIPANDDETYYGIRNFIEGQGIEAFIDNIIVKEVKHNGVLLRKGQKITRALKHFISSPTILDAVQTAMSRIIQQNKVTGTLCISIHPLDYLSVSENNYNWRSCHALDGEYRTGNINYMLDSSTLVCYLKGADGVKLPRFHPDVLWNDKKWRCLLFMSQNKDGVFAGRQYPMTLDAGLNWLYLLLKETITPHLYFNKWTNTRITELPLPDEGIFYCNQPYYPIGGKLIPQSNLIKDGKNTYHFNDLKHSSCYTPYYMTSRYMDTSEFKFHIGQEFACLKCHTNHNHSPDSFFCFECDKQYGTTENDNFAFCPICNSRVARGELNYVEHYGTMSLSNNYICHNCAEENFVQCVDCGIYIPKDFASIHNDEFYCEHCARYRI